MNEAFEKALKAVSAAKDKAVSAASGYKGRIADAIRKAIPQWAHDANGDINWQNLWTGDDKRNAIIGSALGSLVLGVPAFTADRDPEESKLAPVGDALIGALLGGAAGYGIPKGLAMFTNASKMSNKPSTPVTMTDAYLKRPAIVGGTVAGLSAASVVPAHWRARRHLRANADAIASAKVPDLRVKLQDAVNAKVVVDSNPASTAADKLSAQNRVDAARAILHANKSTAQYIQFRERLVAAQSAAKGVDPAKYDRIGRMIKVLDKHKGISDAGGTFADAVRHIPETPIEPAKGPLLIRKPVDWWRHFTRGEKFAPLTKRQPGRRGVQGIRNSVPGRAVINAGKTGGWAALLTMLANYITDAVTKQEPSK